MAKLPPSSIESCGVGQGISPREEDVCPSYTFEEEKDDDGHLLPFLNGELQRWPWPMP